MGLIDDLIADAAPVPYDGADEGETVAMFLGHVVSGRYSSAGEFLLTISIPRDILNPHDLMESFGEMTLWEVRKT